MILGSKYLPFDRRRIMLKKTNRQFTIECLGYPLKRQFKKDFAYKGESHDFAEIVYIESGEMESVENENVYILNSGDMIFHAPLEFHKLGSTGRTTTNCYNISFKWKGKLPPNLFDGVFRLSKNKQSEFLEIFDMTDTYINSTTPTAFSGQEAADKLASFIISLCNNNPIENHFTEITSANHFKKLVTTMNEFLYDNLSLEEISKRSNLSVSYMKILFHRYTDISPKKYYQTLRLNEAMKLIKSGMSFSDITDKMHFSSVNYFSFFFKKNTGMSPLEYKQSSK